LIIKDNLFGSKFGLSAYPKMSRLEPNPVVIYLLVYYFNDIVVLIDLKVLIISHHDTVTFDCHVDLK